MAVLAVGLTACSFGSESGSESGTGGGGDKNSSAGSGSEESKETKPGTAVKVGDFEVTVVELIDPYTMKDGGKPTEDDAHFVAVALSVKNTGAAAGPYDHNSTLVLRDSVGTEMQGMVGDDTATFEGKIPSGTTVKGSAMFQVPDGAKGFTLEIGEDLPSDGPIAATVKLS
ncbi:DUF4352 domain-containing protein [Streptomyces apocyni]|uniref:DUF4352 domain-containing protein n=1 Tax=Streptomyces apocyni TaxID=2654677 RepID=UPI0018D15B75|nr:DUF4352 domain-containing protein [Streptomyces apocyni]